MTGAPDAGAPLLRIRAGIEKGAPLEVLAGVKDADTQGVVLAENVRNMITQWLAVNPVPKQAEPEPASKSPSPARDGGGAPAGGRDADVRQGEGQAGWASSEGRPGKAGVSAVPAQQGQGQNEFKLTPDLLRIALLKFFAGAPTDSDAAKGLKIVEGDDGERYFPLPLLGKAVGLEGEDHERGVRVLKCVHGAPAGIFSLSPDGRGAGLPEWPGWEEFTSAQDQIVTATRDPAFEPRSIQEHVAKVARGAVRAGSTRQADVLRDLAEKLSPQDMPADAAPALRSAISRRTRLALACVVDAVAARGLGPEAGPDSMGLVGQLPRTLFGHIFDNIDDRDRGACAFLGELLQSWDRRRCFSKRWVQTAASKFAMPKGANSERDEGRGWYALTAENLDKKPPEAKEDGGKPAVGSIGLNSEGPSPLAEPKAQRRERSRERSPRRRSASPADAPETQLAAEAKPEKKLPKLSAAAADMAAAEEEAAAGQPGPKKKRNIKDDDEDDATVNRHLEESRKRRAALMEKYQGSK